MSSVVTRASKGLGADCKVTRVGTGKNVDLILEGSDAHRIAEQLVRKAGFTIGHAFGTEAVVK